MRSFLIKSLNDINIYEKFIDPATGNEVVWAIVILEYDPDNNTYSQKVESFFKKMLNIHLAPAANGFFTVNIADRTVAPTSYGSYLNTKNVSRNYSFLPGGTPGTANVVGADDWVVYMQGNQSTQFDVVGGQITVKAVEGNDTKKYTHEIWYGPIS